MDDTLVFWTHNAPMPYVGVPFVGAQYVNYFRAWIDILRSPASRQRYNRIIVSSFNEMQISFGIKLTGELLEELSTLEQEYDYTVIVLPHSNELVNYYY